MTPVILFGVVSAGCAMLAYVGRGQDRLVLIAASLGWAAIAVLAHHVG